MHCHGIVLIALFGSVARLTPHDASDTDLLVLFDVANESNPRTRIESLARNLLAGIMDVVYADAHPWPRWGIATITGDASTCDLDTDLLAVIGREGVCLYQSEHARLPDTLAHLMRFDVWTNQVDAYLRGQRQGQ